MCQWRIRPAEAFVATPSRRRAERTTCVRHSKKPAASSKNPATSQWTARHRRLAAFAGRSRTAMLWLALMVPEACRVLLHCHENGAYGSCRVRSPGELRTASVVQPSVCAAASQHNVLMPSLCMIAVSIRERVFGRSVTVCYKRLSTHTFGSDTTIFTLALELRAHGQLCHKVLHVNSKY